MSSTSEPKAFIGALSKFVWGVWLFSGFSILLHYFPLELRFPSFSSSSAPASVSAPPVRQRTAEAPSVGSRAIPWDVLNAPESPGVMRFMDGAQAVSLDVPVGRWSAQVETPEDSKHYAFDVKPDGTVFYLKFSDGAVFKVGGDAPRFIDLDERRGIMRFLGTVPDQKAIVAISDTQEGFAAPKGRKVIKRVEVGPDWSDDWTTLPAGGNYSLVYPNRSFDLLFENGEIRSYDDDGRPKDRDPLPGNRFRLRGIKGTLEIVEDP